MTSRTASHFAGLTLCVLACQPSSPPGPPAAPAAATQAPSAAITQAPSAGAAPFAGPGCRVVQDAKLVYEGPCDIAPDPPTGSFSLTPKAAKDLGGANPLTVSPLSDGTAEVRGLTADGINARWGAARRSTTNAACWVGDDFEICAAPLPGGGASPAPSRP